MAYTTPSTQLAGTLITSTMYKAHIIDNIKFLHGPPTCRVKRTATVQSIPSGVYTAIAFSGKDWDSNNMFVSTGSRVNIKTAGKYLATFHSNVLNSSLGTFRGVAILKSATAVTSDNQDMVETLIGSSAIYNSQLLSVTGLFSMTTTDYLSGALFQDSGGAVNTSTFLRRAPKLSVLWISS